MRAQKATPPVKPRLRGVSHQIAFFVALAAGTWLASSAAPGTARLGATIYSSCLAALFGISALYHRPTWTPRARQWMRRLDHCGIFLQIAGTFTPFALVLPPAEGRTMLLVAWVGAAAGIVLSLVWVHAPKVLSAAVYVALGWAALPFAGTLYARLGLGAMALIGLGGVAYSVGAAVYALRRPNPAPAIFGYHEIFHALTIIAAALHFQAVRVALALV